MHRLFDKVFPVEFPGLFNLFLVGVWFILQTNEFPLHKSKVLICIDCAVSVKLSISIECIL